MAVLVAAACSAAAAVVLLAAVFVLGRRVSQLRETVSRLERESVPLVRDARVVMEQAASEMERVGDVLASTEAVSETVNSASRLAYRVFANPVVKVLAYSTGISTALRRLFARHPSPRPQSSLGGPRRISTTDTRAQSPGRSSRRDLRHARRDRARQLT